MKELIKSLIRLRYILMHDIEDSSDLWKAFEVSLKDASDTPENIERHQLEQDKFNNISGKFETLIESINEFIESASYYDIEGSETIEFNFGDVVRLMNKGYAFKRKNWNNKFIVKQIPAIIGDKVIPFMQSLPDTAKAALLKTENPCRMNFIKYRFQMLCIFNDGSADNYIPSAVDIFAEDWIMFNNRNESSEYMIDLRAKLNEQKKIKT